VKPYIRNSSVPKTLKIIVLRSFNKGSFIGSIEVVEVFITLVASDELFQSAWFQFRSIVN